jgi:hypothetical protein
MVTPTRAQTPALWESQLQGPFIKIPSMGCIKPTPKKRCSQALSLSTYIPRHHAAKFDIF